jgi:hypothetical protein
MEEIFKELLLFMFEEKYILWEEYYCDGSSFQADVNRHKVTWRKNIERRREEPGAHIDKTPDRIDVLNAEVSQKLSRITGRKDSNPERKKQTKAMGDALEEHLLRDRACAAREEQCGERCGYSQTVF